jgi:guanine deaminase
MDLSEHDKACLAEAIALARENAGRSSDGGGPFGAVIAQQGRIIARGVNSVTYRCDPTAHAEIVAIREACQLLASHSLAGCILYTSCEPCPMCLTAALWARVDGIVYASSRQDAAAAGFDDEVFYSEVAKLPPERSLPCKQGLREQGGTAFTAWQKNPHRKPY